MALNQDVFFTKLMRRVRTIVDNTAGGVVVADNQGTDPSRVMSINLLGDTSDRTIEVFHDTGSHSVMLFTGVLPANAGLQVNNPAFGLIRTQRIIGLELDDRGNFFYDLPNGHRIRIRTTAAPTVSVTAFTLIRDFAA